MSETPFLQALREHKVSAKVVDIDHYRIQGGLAVESDYIITVRPDENDKGDAAAAAADSSFEGFTISKTYSAFRTMAQQLKKVATAAKKKKKTAGDDDDESIIKYCDLVFHLIDAQRTAYLGKVNYMYVQVLAKQRKQIIDDVLSATCSSFPTTASSDSKSVAGQVASILETFLLTDHVVLEGDDDAASPRSDSERSASSSRGGKQNATTLDNLNPLAWISKTASSSKNNNKKGGSSNPLSVDTTKAMSNDALRRTTVVPITRRSRKSSDQREIEENELTKVGEDARLLVDDDRQQQRVLPSYARPVPVVRGSSQTGAVARFLETNPAAFLLIAVLAVALLQQAAKTVISTDGDIFLLVAFACYCLGLHTPRAVELPVLQGTAAVKRPDRSGRKLLRRSMIVTSPAARNRASVAAGVLQASVAQVAASLGVVAEEDLMESDIDFEEDSATLSSPLPKFPEGAKIGSHFNCWSCPDSVDFAVRGPNYLADKKKIASDDYLFPCRGLDLFLTDMCPTNIGRNAGVMGGKLREVPTFIINFVLPWGVLLFYCEIPKKFVPFVEAKNDTEKDKLIPVLKDMTSAERTTARWLMGDNNEKNKTFKIVPVVVDGPWVVKSVVGGKPAIIGDKLPINYVYQPAEDGGNKALYIEADMDIAASSAARGILSVTRSYTNVLTINLGFVIQGNESDELPEQMLMGARLHGIDPLTAPSFPASEDDLLNIGVQSSDEESV